LAKTRPNITPDHREKIALDPSNETANIAAGMNTVKIKMPTRRKTIIKISTRQTNQMTKPSRKLTSTRPTSPSWTAHFHWTYFSSNSTSCASESHIIPNKASNPDMASSVPSSSPVSKIHNDPSSMPVTTNHTIPVTMYVVGSANTAIARARNNPADDPRSIDMITWMAINTSSNGISATTTTLSIPG